jgi:CRISPR-associated endonuclease Csn1
MFDSTVYGLRGPGKVTYRQMTEAGWGRPLLNREVVPFADASATASAGPRHGLLPDGTPKPYMGLWSRSNYCIEIWRTEQGAWDAAVIETYRAYQIVARDGLKRLRHRALTQDGRPLVMRLMIDDSVKLQIDGEPMVLRVMKINSTGQVTFTRHNETNISARYAAKLKAQKEQRAGTDFDANALNDEFFQRSISPDSLRAFSARAIAVSPIGEVRDPGFQP